MADNIEITPGSGSVVAADLIDGALYQRIKLCVGEDGTAVDASATNPVPVEISSGSVTLTGGSVVIGDVSLSSGSLSGSLPAGDNNIGNVDIVTLPNVIMSSGSITSLPAITGTVTATGPLTDAELRASEVPISGSIAFVGVPEITFTAGSITSMPDIEVTGCLTDDELRATPVPISGSVVGSFYPETQPVSGSVSVVGTVPVSGTFWQDTQPVSGTVAVTGTFYQDTQPVSGSVSVVGTVPVSGTFYQDTQPISGSVSIVGTPTVNVSSLEMTSGSLSGSLPAGDNNIGNMDIVTMPNVVMSSGSITSLPSVTIGSLPNVVISSGSITSMPDIEVTGCLTDAELRAAEVPVSGSVVVISAPTTAVTGTFYQDIQPISGSVAVIGTVPVSGTVTASGPLTDAELRASEVPISGSVALVGTSDVTFTAGSITSMPNIEVTGCLTDDELRASEVPISGSVVVISAPTTAVTGTFWQDTQPISGSINLLGTSEVSGSLVISSGSITSMPEVAVTGTFYQAEQPISGSVAIVGTVPVSGTFYQDTQPVSGSFVISSGSITSLPAVSMTSGSLTGSLPAGTNTIGALTANQSVSMTSGSLTGSIPAGTNTIGALTANQSVSMTSGSLTGSIPAGTAAIGTVGITSGSLSGSIPAGQAIIGAALPFTTEANYISGSSVAVTDTTRTEIISAQGAGIKIYLTNILVTNGHATVGTIVKIEDGTTCKYTGFAAAGGGGFSATLPVPLVGTANTAWNMSATTTGGSVVCSLSGYKGA